MIYILCVLMIPAMLFSTIAVDQRCRQCRRWWGYQQAEDDDPLKRRCCHCGHTL